MSQRITICTKSYHAGPLFQFKINFYRFKWNKCFRKTFVRFFVFWGQTFYRIVFREMLFIKRRRMVEMEDGFFKFQKSNFVKNVCVWERERVCVYVWERYIYIYIVCVCVCVCLCMNVCEIEREREGKERVFKTNHTNVTNYVYFFSPTKFCISPGKRKFTFAARKLIKGRCNSIVFFSLISTWSGRYVPNRNCDKK